MFFIIWKVLELFHTQYVQYLNLSLVIYIGPDKEESEYEKLLPQINFLNCEIEKF